MLNASSNDLREPIHRNQGTFNYIVGEWIRFNEFDGDGLGELIHSSLYDCDDPHESTVVNFYNSDFDYSPKTQVRSDITFTTSAAGLIELSNMVYYKLCQISLEFARTVSSSMFLYYVSQLHYMRLCLLEWKVKKPEAEDLRVMNKIILHNRWIVPQLLADYFNSIGSFNDSSGVPAHHREIIFPCADEIDGINGFFGRVDSNTHVHYENRISPGVVALRIIKDLISTIYPMDRNMKNGFWDLPKILVPSEKNFRGPTANLLGWSFARNLTSEQESVLKDCGVSISPGQITFSHSTRFCHNNLLMSYISTQLSKLTGRMKCEERLSTITNGSIAQQDFQLVGPHGGITLTYIYGDMCTYNCGLEPLHMYQELHAHAFRFRLAKRKMVQSNGLTIHPWCCYDFNSYTEVPESWFKTSNSYFLHDKFKKWDIGWYKTQQAVIRHFLNGLMVKTLIQ